jgi:hypothetical protein
MTTYELCLRGFRYWSEMGQTARSQSGGAVLEQVKWRLAASSLIFRYRSSSPSHAIGDSIVSGGGHRTSSRVHGLLQHHGTRESRILVRWRFSGELWNFVCRAVVIINKEIVNKLLEWHIRNVTGSPYRVVIILG